MSLRGGVHPIILALAPTERHDVDAVVFGEVLDGIDEALRHRRHQRRRRHAGAPELAEEVRRAGRPLQHRHVDVQVQPVDALEGQRRVLRQDLGDGSCYLHGSDSGRWAPHRPVYGHRRLRATMNAASRRRGSSGRSPADRQQTPRSACLVGLRRSLASGVSLKQVCNSTSVTLRHSRPQSPTKPGVSASRRPPATSVKSFMGQTASSGARAQSPGSGACGGASHRLAVQITPPRA